MRISIAAYIRKIAVQFATSKALQALLTELGASDPHSKMPKSELQAKFFEIIDKFTGHGLKEDTADKWKAEAEALPSTRRLLHYMTSLAFAGGTKEDNLRVF